MVKPREANAFRILIVDDDQVFHDDLKKILTVKNSDATLNRLANVIFDNKTKFAAKQPPAFKIQSEYKISDAVEFVQQAQKDHNSFALLFIDIHKQIDNKQMQAIKDIRSIDKNIQIVICTLHVNLSWEMVANEFGFDDNLIVVGKPFDTVTVRQLVYVLVKKWELAQLQRHYHQTIDDSSNYDLMSYDLEQLQLENQMHDELKLEQFELHYQPQFDLTTGECVSVEALVRWRHPERGMIAPNRFISIAEQSELIVPLGAWVLEVACQQAMRWREEGFEPLRVAVNVAKRQFEQHNFIAQVKEILDKTKLNPQFLELELTENMIIDQQIVKKIHVLKSMGVKIALDDFGSGSSSISHVKKLPLDRIKIDQAFIKNIAINPDDEAIICAIIALAKSLNLRVLAEGVESRKQIDFLLQNKCHEVQGMWLSKALPSEKLAATLKKARAKMDSLQKK